jgi:hypothetical protein
MYFAWLSAACAYAAYTSRDSPLPCKVPSSVCFLMCMAMSGYVVLQTRYLAMLHEIADDL